MQRSLFFFWDPLVLFLQVGNQTYGSIHILSEVLNIDAQLLDRQLGLIDGLLLFLDYYVECLQLVIEPLQRGTFF